MPGFRLLDEGGEHLFGEARLFLFLPVDGNILELLIKCRLAREAAFASRFHHRERRLTRFGVQAEELQLRQTASPPDVRRHTASAEIPA